VRRALEAQVETYFLQALDVARRQQVKSLKLRTAINLSRLWQGQGEWKEETHQLLAEVYNLTFRTASFICVNIQR
jgi:hypothetical protein